MPTTDRHRTKRPFQPAITSFFPAAHSLDDHHEHPRRPRPPPSAAPQRESLAPPLPGHVQADLLSVGMRVRKSVPEGYKTTSSTKMAALPSIQTTLAKPHMPGLDVKPPRDAVPDDFVHQRELLPFCGLHKIGGFAEQPTTNIHLYGGLDAAGNRPQNLFPLPAEAFSQPFSSQDSGYGSDVTRFNPPNSSKRSWQDDDKPSNHSFFFNPIKVALDVDDVPVSPLSESPPPSFDARPAARQIAQPKSRRPHVLRTGSEDSMDTDMSFEDPTQGPGRISSSNPDDFEEADFLDGHEVTMSGVN